MPIFITFLAVLFFWGAGSLGITGCSSSRPAAADSLAAPMVQAELKRLMATKAGDVTHLGSRKRVEAFYTNREYRPLWISHGKAHGQIQALMEQLGNAGWEGLAPRNYHFDTLTALIAAHTKAGEFWSADSGRAARTEILLTDAWFTFAGHLLNGRASTSRFEIPGEIFPETEPLDTLLLEAIRSRDLDAAVSRLLPRHEDYARLREALAELQSGDTTISGQAPDLATRIRNVRMSMERWRWLPRELGERHILVNIPDFHLELRNKGVIELEMKVVAGHDTTQTPFMSDTLTHVVFNPYWFVPASIVRSELAPKIAEQKDFFQTTDYEMVDSKTAGEDSAEHLDPETVEWSELGKETEWPFTIRQKPGPKNALGRVKFLFPNRFSIYLHDTPNQAAFRREVRAGSHGCVRVENPVELAEKILQGQDGLAGDSLRKAIDSGARRHIRLEKPLPVHLVYFTASVDDEGRVRFSPDIYGWDADLSGI